MRMRRMGQYYYPYSKGNPKLQENSAWILGGNDFFKLGLVVGLST